MPRRSTPVLIALVVLVVPASGAAVDATPLALLDEPSSLARSLARIADDASSTPAARALDAASLSLAARSADVRDPALLGLAAQQERNLATTRLLLDGMDARADPLDRALWAAAQSSAWQLAALGAAPDAPLALVAHGSPSDAVRAIASRQAQATELDAAALARLDALPVDVQAPLLRTLDAFVSFHDAVATGFASAGIEARADEDLASFVTGRGTIEALSSAASRAELAAAFAPAIAARAAFLSTIPALHDALADHAAGSGCAPIVVAPAFALDADGCGSFYGENVALLIDAGGDDVYENNAGGFPGMPCAPAVPTAGASALVDLAGNDRYQDAPGAVTTFPGILCGVNGGANVGAGLLLDLAGDDLYERVSQASNGGSSQGLGLLVDADGANTYLGANLANGGAIEGLGALLDLGEGDSIYIGQDVGANGGGCFGGYAFLVDAGGSDLYRSTGGCGSNGQGGGAAPSVAFVLDAGTSADVYEGRNGGGGLASAGFLFDEGGDDTYVGPAIGISQGGGSNGVGMLVDVAGNDKYTGGHLGSNGGAMGGLGALLDLDGDDAYVGGSLATNGGASDEGHGFLFDARGNDRYDAGGIATNGGGFFAGDGFLLDLSGDDAYVAKGNGVNGGGSTLFPGMGRLVDLSGLDRYLDEDGGSGADVTLVPKGTLGAQLDLEGSL